MERYLLIVTTLVIKDIGEMASATVLAIVVSCHEDACAALDRVD